MNLPINSFVFTTYLMSRCWKQNTVLEKGLRTTVLDIAMMKFGDESRSINYCFCTVLVSCTVMYSILVIRYVYTVHFW